MVLYRMPEAVQIAVEKYIRAFSERDPVARAALLEACFAVELAQAWVAAGRGARLRRGPH
ncbi:MAG: hypothetical protein ABIQ16_06715 [Polyangiaceae bacterium]